ncbi:YegS/Rv2252/BmrU family lipid kinase [uncultured Sphingomonas sp.]|uniref:diacylglycerol/lipid kinase family protein n=1 Tax=uncultured Sphingomonas sp. TaxID=158754 RepID=UPI0026011FC0|nr:YegS/Rv2252/BmrU family lipid kinase [uncultured Sphingomonas sp.]
MNEQLPRSAALVVNAKSRNGQEAFREACRLLTEAGVELVSAVAVRDPDHLTTKVCEAVRDGAPMVIVGGGDGSLSSSVDHLVGTDAVFAILPLGTANSFSRTVEIPLDVAGAVKVIAEGKPHRIDLGMIDDDYFVNCAAIGISPLIAETVPHGLKKRLGRPGYLAWAAVQMARFKPFRLFVEDDAGKIHEMNALEVRIANGRYHGGTELVETSVDDGEIVVQAIEGRARSKLLWSWGLSLLGPDKVRGTVREFRGRRFRIRTDPPLPISIDGEVLAKTPVMARVAHRVITMAVPR